MNTDHVVFNSVNQAFACLHCGALHMPTLPLPITQFVSMGKGFELMHKHCQKPVAPSPQLPLPHTDAPMPERQPYAEFPDHRPMAGIDGSSDEPDPETDPPPPNPYAMFHMNYPKAETYDDMVQALRTALRETEWGLLDLDVVHAWHPKSGQFEAVAHWARVENAHNSAGKRPPTPGLTIPQRFSMPLALAQALATSQPKVKAPRKKAATRKAAASKGAA